MSPVSFQAAAKPDECDLLLYGEISSGDSWFGETVSDVAFVQALDSQDGKRVNVRINSVGGDAFAGIAMYNALRAYGEKHRDRKSAPMVRCTVEGLAASAASIVAMAGPCK